MHLNNNNILAFYLWIFLLNAFHLQAKEYSRGVAQLHTGKRESSKKEMPTTTTTTLSPYPYRYQPYLDLSNDFYRKLLFREPQNSNELNSIEDMDNHLANVESYWPKMYNEIDGVNEQYKRRHSFTPNQEQQQQQQMRKHAANIRFQAYLPSFVMQKRLAQQESAAALRDAAVAAAAAAGDSTVNNLFPLREDDADTFDIFYRKDNNYNSKNYNVKQQLAQENDEVKVNSNSNDKSNADAADDDDVDDVDKVFNNGNGNESLNYSDDNKRHSNDMETYSHPNAGHNLNSMFADNLEYLTKVENIKENSMKRAKPLSGHTPFLPAVSGGAMTNLGKFFRDLSKNVHFSEQYQWGADEQNLLNGEHSLGNLHQHMKQPDDQTSDLIDAIRFYRPSQKIRSLVERNPHGQWAHSSQFIDPNYYWVGLGKK